MKNIAEALTEYKQELRETAMNIEKGAGESNLLENLNKIIVIAFILAIIFIWYWQDNTKVLIGIFSATGITVPWAINTTIKLWKDISNAETLHVLISHLDDKKTTKEIVKILSETLYK
jgi:hypothetical protein